MRLHFERISLEQELDPAMQEALTWGTLDKVFVVSSDLFDDFPRSGAFGHEINVEKASALPPKTVFVLERFLYEAILEERDEQWAEIA